MNDLWLFLGGLLFLFIIWVYSGGPNNPISFAGPYITPVTGPGVTQVGYDDGSSKFLTTGAKSPSTSSGSPKGSTSNSQSFWNTGVTNGSSAQTTFSNPSSYVGRVHIEGGQTNASSANEQYLLLHSDSNSAINISGWQLVSLKYQVRETIPLGTPTLQRSSGTVAPITLSAGGEAVVTTGISPFGISFPENKCTGYLYGSAVFVPPLVSYSCPAPLDELRTSYSASTQSEFNACAQFIQNVPTCKIPNSEGAAIPASCQQFIDAHLNYEGCIASHRTDTDFKGTVWRIYLGENHPTWGPSDSIMLLDANGKTVDVYSY